jgi:hypothetical protein
MTQKLPDQKLNHNSPNTFEIHIKVPRGGEFSLKLHPQAWNQITHRLKNPLIWLLLVIGGGSLLSPQLSLQLLPQIAPPSNPPAIQPSP